MDDKIRAKVQELLESGKIQGFLGLRDQSGHIGPYLFTNVSELEGLLLGDREVPGDNRYPLNKILLTLTSRYPDMSFGVLARGCDERGLKTLFSSNQLNPEKIVSVGIACPQALADVCECMKPFPDEFVLGEQCEARPFGTVERIEAMALDERFESWLSEFSKCIKCYGCRNICPMCYCQDCTLENHNIIQIGSLAPENPVFHLTRALHMAGRCIDCGLCNEACPADIPLRTLYKKIADIFEQEFQYRPGYNGSKSKPSLNIPGETAKH